MWFLVVPRDLGAKPTLAILRVGINSFFVAKHFYRCGAFEVLESDDLFPARMVQLPLKVSSISLDCGVKMAAMTRI